MSEGIDLFLIFAISLRAASNVHFYVEVTYLDESLRSAAWGPSGLKRSDFRIV